MYNIAWYARDGHLDILPLISSKLIERDINIRSHYICNTELEEEHLNAMYGIKSPFIIASYLRENLEKINISNDKIRLLEQTYNTLPLIQSVWSTIFEQNLSEEMILRFLVSHIECWRSFLTTNKIDMLVGEAPSILSTCAAWIVCKNLQIDFVSFINLPIGHRISLTSSWQAYIDGFEEKNNNLNIDKNSVNYRMSVEYLKKMNLNPEKTKEAQSNIDATRAKEIRRSPIDFNKIRKMPKYWRRYLQRKQYYLYPTISQQLLAMLKFYINLRYYKYTDIFKKINDLDKKKFFLFPLHMQGEWSDYNWMGPSYNDQTMVVKNVAGCMPLKYTLYVKEHTANFGEKPPLFYKRIKNIKRTKLIHPDEDTFQLIRQSEGIITLGSTVGFEAFLIGKPVIILGEPWYRNLTGIYRADKPEILAKLLQNIKKLRTATEDEKLKTVYSLYELSFSGVRYPHSEVLAHENIDQFAMAFEKRITYNSHKNSLKAL